MIATIRCYMMLSTFCKCKDVQHTISVYIKCPDIQLTIITQGGGGCAVRGRLCRVQVNSEQVSLEYFGDAWERLCGPDIVKVGVRVRARVRARVRVRVKVTHIQTTPDSGVCVCALCPPRIRKSAGSSSGCSPGSSRGTAGVYTSSASTRSP